MVPRLPIATLTLVSSYCAVPRIMIWFPEAKPSLNLINRNTLFTLFTNTLLCLFTFPLQTSGRIRFAHVGPHGIKGHFKGKKGKCSNLNDWHKIFFPFSQIYTFFSDSKWASDETISRDNIWSQSYIKPGRILTRFPTPWNICKAAGPKLFVKLKKELNIGTRSFIVLTPSGFTENGPSLC